MSFRIDAMLRNFLCLLAVAALSGCATAPFKVTAMRFDVEPPRQRIFQIAKPTITGADGSVDAGKLTAYVSTALLNRGFSAAPPGSPPEMVIDVFFEQQLPRIETRTETEKIYQWQPEQTVLTTRQTKTPTGLVLTETVPKKVAAHSKAVGSRTVNYLVEIFPKRLRIVGRTPIDPSLGEAGRPLWSVEVRHEGEIHDLSRFAVQMIAAAMDDLGNDFSGEKTVFVSAGDRRTKIIRRPRTLSDQTVAPPLPDGRSQS